MNRGLLNYSGIAILAICFLALYPQISLWISQGSNWRGSYFVSNYDETAYSAYVNKLIEGEPRKSDPFLGYSDESTNLEQETLYSIQFIPAYFIASASHSRSLWNAHTSSAGGVDIEENKRLSPTELSDGLKQNSFEMLAAIFGSERALPSLGTVSVKISADEINDEIKKYADFAKNFDEKESEAPLLSSIIVPTEAKPSFANVDRWYLRDKGKDFGLFTVYRLTLKSAQ